MRSIFALALIAFGLFFAVIVTATVVDAVVGPPPIDVADSSTVVVTPLSTATPTVSVPQVLVSTPTIVLSTYIPAAISPASRIRIPSVQARPTSTAIVTPTPTAAAISQDVVPISTPISEPTAVPTTPVVIESVIVLPIKVSIASTTVDIATVLRLRDPSTLKLLREQRVVVPNVDLALYGSTKLPADVYLKGAVDQAAAAISESLVTLRDPVIEKVTVGISDGGTLLSVLVQVNISASITGYETRVRLFLEGLDYTNLDPVIDTLSDILDDIETTILLRFS